jgi:hypothetical protein
MERHADETGGAEGLLAGIAFRRDEDVDAILHRVAGQLRDAGIHVHGLISHNLPDPRSQRCIMYVENLADGARFRISQDLGPDATGCRLDPDGLARACVAARSSLGPDTEFVILNRFGRAESEGGGVRGIIEDCLAAGIPLLIAVREAYDEAWQGFHGGLADRLPNDEAAVAGWCLKAASAGARAIPG